MNFLFYGVVEFVIERTEENGGTVSFKDYASLEQAFARQVSPDNCPSLVHAFILEWFSIQSTKVNF